MAGCLERGPGGGGGERWCGCATATAAWPWLELRARDALPMAAEGPGTAGQGLGRAAERAAEQAASEVGPLDASLERLWSSDSDGGLQLCCEQREQKERRAPPSLSCRPRLPSQLLGSAAYRPPRLSMNVVPGQYRRKRQA